MGPLEPQEGMRRHKLLSKEVIASLPPLYSQERNPDPTVMVKFFSPYSGWIWLAYEGDHVDEDGIPVRESKKPATDYLFFGLVKGMETELGYFSFNEMARAKITVGGIVVPAVERDLYYKPTPLSKAREDPPETVSPQAQEYKVGDRIVTTTDISWMDYENVEHYVPEETEGVIVKLGPIQMPGKMDYEVRPIKPIRGIGTFFVYPNEFRRA